MQTKVKNPRKQRKRLYNAPAHIRHKIMAAPLIKDLAKKHGVKTLPVRKGDTVRIQRGDNKGFEGKISRIDLKNYRIYIEGLTREKVDGTNIFLPVHPSKVAIKSFSLNDKRRKAVVERKKPIEKDTTPKPTQKPILTVKPKPKPKIFVIEEIEKPAKPVAAKPVAAKPVAAKPVAAKPVAAKPVIVKKAPTAKKTAVSKAAAASKPSAKPKTPKKTEGGQ
jgi:large subunit ribosomal protein L24